LILSACLWVGCGPKQGNEVPGGGAVQSQPVTAQPADSPKTAAVDKAQGFALLVVEDRAGQLAVASGHLGQLARLGVKERRGVLAAWQQPAPATRRAGEYCGRLLDSARRQAALRCVRPRNTAHLAPRTAGAPPTDKPLNTVAFSLRLPWPATATGSGWTLEIGAPDGRTATWRPRE